MDDLDRGKVKFQNAFEYYDIMYNLYRNMLKASFSCNVSMMDSVMLYKKSLIELYYFVECFLDKENIAMQYKTMIITAINNLELDEKQVSDIFGCDNKQSEIFCQETNEEESSTIIKNINIIDGLIKKASIYKENKIQLPKHLIKVKELLDDSKRILAHEMKINKLTVPINNFDARNAIKHGF